MKKIKTVLGWVINQSMIVYLPNGKYNFYLIQSKDIIRLKRVEDKNLEYLIRRLERMSYAVPNAKLFINRFHHLQYTMKKVDQCPTIYHR